MKAPEQIQRRDIFWTSKTEYYDVDTGDQISKNKAEDKTKYIKIKTNKNVKINEHQTRGTIEYTIECKKQPQTRLF